MIRGGDWYGGWGPPAVADTPPGWRVLTAADFGARVEGTAGLDVTLTDSGDPLYPVRVDLPSVSVSGNTCWPIIGDAAAILDRQAMANPIMFGRVNQFSAGTNTIFAVGVGSFDGTTANSILGAGFLVQTRSGGRADIGKTVFAGNSTNVLLGAARYDPQSTANPIPAFITLWAPDTGTSENRIANATVGDPTLTGFPVASTQTASGDTRAALAAGTREWCFVVNRYAATTNGQADLAIWIMETPPPPPYIPQP